MNAEKPTFMTLTALARFLDAEICGEGPDFEVTGMATLDRAGPCDISFLTNAKYRHLLLTTRAGAVLVSGETGSSETCRLLKVRDAYLAVAQLTAMFHPAVLPPQGIHPSACVSAEARVAPDAAIAANVVIEEGAGVGTRTALYPGVYLGRNSTIGSDCIIYPNVTIYHGVTIGNNAIIHAGTVIGSDGFGYAKDGCRYIKVNQIGGVIIGDDVEIGANCTIDRGSIGVTTIGRGVKLDNLIHIAHNVKIGEDTAMAAQCGVAGSSVIGNRNMFAGQAAVSGHVTLGDDVVLTARTVAIKDVPDKMMVSGFPHMPHREWKRNQISLRNIEKLETTVKKLVESVRALELKLGNQPIPGKEQSGDIENGDN